MRAELNRVRGRPVPRMSVLFHSSSRSAMPRAGDDSACRAETKGAGKCFVVVTSVKVSCAQPSAGSGDNEFEFAAVLAAQSASVWRARTSFGGRYMWASSHGVRSAA